MWSEITSVFQGGPPAIRVNNREESDAWDELHTVGTKSRGLLFTKIDPFRRNSLCYFMGCGPRGIWRSKWTQLRPHGLRFQRLHFTPFLTPCSAGVNLLHQDLSICDGITVNAYVFPAFSLIGPLLWFLRSQWATVTFMVPRLSPLPVWWPIINSMSNKKVLIACKGSTYTILFPKKQGFQLGELPFELWAFRVGPTVWVKVINISYSSFFLDSRYGSSTTCTSSIVSQM